MIQITCSQAKRFLENIIRNHEKHTGILAINPLNKKTTPAARDAYERANTFNYEFSFKKNGITHYCHLESVTFCPNNDVVYYENYVIDSKLAGMKDVKKIYKQLTDK